MESSNAPQIQSSPVAPSVPPAEPANPKRIANGMVKSSNLAIKDEEKLSAAEQKRRNKAEKQARREQRKQESQAGAATGKSGQDTKGEVGKTQLLVDAQTTLERVPRGQAQGSKEERRPHVKQSASGVADNQKLPVRGAAAKRTESATAVSATGTKEVALFGHLYGQPKRTSVAGAGREIHPAVLALGLQMSNYVICGSNARCVATLFCFKRVIESYTTPPGTTLTRHLTSHLSPQIDYLKSCRPLSVSMGNAIRWLKLEISDIDIDVPEADAKAQLCESIDNFIRERITVADQVISASARGKIKDGDVILTYAKSSIVQKTLIDAYNQGIRFRVIVIDSKPLFEGKHLARTLALLGLEVQYSLMHALSHAIKDASKVFLGAHAMMSNGRLYSRVGTAVVAMMASDADVPVIVCCESVKFTERVALDSIVNNEIAPPDELVPLSSSSRQQQQQPSRGGGGSGEVSAAEQQQISSSSSLPSPLVSWQDTPNLQLLNIMYDVTPAEYIKMVITEYGSLPPSSVPVVHRLSTNS